MDIYRLTERLMGMDASAWARHANPWSGWSRLATGPLIFLSLYSVHWIGWWAAVPICVCATWVVLNPRLFPPPDRVDGWMQQGVLGERAFLNRRRIPIPRHHLVPAHVATGTAAAFMLVSVSGIVAGLFPLAAIAWLAAVMAKVWFIDRMVWLWTEVQQDNPVYAAWSRADWSADLDA